MAKILSDKNSLPLKATNTNGTNWSEAPVERVCIPGREDTCGFIVNVNFEGAYPSFSESRFGRK